MIRADCADVSDLTAHIPCCRCSRRCRCVFRHVRPKFLGSDFVDVRYIGAAADDGGDKHDIDVDHDIDHDIDAATDRALG